MWFGLVSELMRFGLVHVACCKLAFYTHTHTHTHKSISQVNLAAPSAPPTDYGKSSIVALMEDRLKTKSHLLARWFHIAFPFQPLADYLVECQIHVWKYCLLSIHQWLSYPSWVPNPRVKLAFAFHCGFYLTAEHDAVASMEAATWLTVRPQPECCWQLDRYLTQVTPEITFHHILSYMLSFLWVVCGRASGNIL